MDDIEHIENQNKKRLEAIRSRRLLLERVYSRNGRISEKSGLIALSRVIFLFASRFIERPEWPGHDVSDDTRQLWELEWYSALLNALCALLPVIQRAVKDGKLIVRDGLTRAPLGDDSFREWVAIDIAVEVENQSKLFWTESPPEDGMLGKWPDAGLHPLGLFVLEGELIRWAEDAGIATEPEIQRLLTPSPQKSDAENMPSVSKADKSPDWKETARLIADKFFDHDTKLHTRDTLSGYAVRVMDEMQERKIHGPRGLIDNPNTIQRDALQGVAWWRHKKK